MLDEYPVRLPIRVRLRDTDMMGHVNNAVYLTYFESGRIEYWVRLTGDPSLEGLTFLLARAEVDFLAEGRAGESLLLGIRAGRLGTKSFDLEYELVREADGTPLARGRSVQVMYDYETGETRPISDELRQMISELEGARV